MSSKVEKRSGCKVTKKLGSNVVILYFTRSRYLTLGKPFIFCNLEGLSNNSIFVVKYKTCAFKTNEIRYLVIFIH
jgi:hypothetical protein